MNEMTQESVILLRLESLVNGRFISTVSPKIEKAWPTYFNKKREKIQKMMNGKVLCLVWSNQKIWFPEDLFSFLLSSNFHPIWAPIE